MTDLQSFIELYSKFGITCVVNQCPNTGNSFIVFCPEYYSLDLNEWNGNCSPTKTDKIEGFNGFYSQIDFDKDGKFVGQGFWE